MEQFLLLDFLSDNNPSPLDSLELFDGSFDTNSNSDDNSNTSLTYSDDSPTISEIPFSFNAIQDFHTTEKAVPSISKPISKKKRKSASTSPKEEKRTSVTLDRDLLINMSLEEFESQIEQLTKGRSLTKEETNDIKRQRRLIKNRHSAMASRERKREEFTVLKQENEALKKEVSYLKSVIEFLTVGKNLPTAESVPFLLIFGLIFSVMFWSQAPIANQLNTTHTSTAKTPLLINLNVQQETRQTPLTKEASPLGRELMSLNDTNDDQSKDNTNGSMDIMNSSVHANYIVSSVGVNPQIHQIYLSESDGFVASDPSAYTPYSSYSQHSSHPQSVIVM